MKQITTFSFRAKILKRTKCTAAHLIQKSRRKTITLSRNIAETAHAGIAYALEHGQQVTYELGLGALLAGRTMLIDPGNATITGIGSMCLSRQAWMVEMPRMLLLHCGAT